MRIIHTADLHLDSKMGELPSKKSKIRREETLRTFERLTEFADKNGVNAVIIAGDMFDTAKVSEKTRAGVLHAILSTPNVNYMYLSGNHDDDNFIDKLSTLPKNLKFFNDNWTKFSYENVSIVGAKLTGVNNRALFDTLSLNSEDVNIVVLHGQIAGYNSTEKAETIPLPKFKDKNVDYLALGHYHSAVKERLDNRGVYAYSGCLDGRGFDETGDKGFILIDVDDKSLSSQFIKFSSRNMYEHVFNIEGYDNFYTARDKLIEELSSYSSDSLIKVVLEGEHTTDFIIDKDGLEQRLSERFFYVKVKDKTTLKVSALDYADDKSVRGEFVRAVWESDLDDDIKAKVILKGLSALKGEEI